jgi:hypothetical protein
LEDCDHDLLEGLSYVFPGHSKQRIARPFKTTSNAVECQKYPSIEISGVTTIRIQDFSVSNVVNKKPFTGS